MQKTPSSAIGGLPLARGGIAIIAGLLIAVYSSSICFAGTDTLDFKPDTSGSITTWLVSQPFAMSYADDFDKDLLTEFGGEANVKPDGLVTEAKDADGNLRRIDWRPMFSDKPVVRPYSRQTDSRAAYYMSCMLKPQRSGDHILVTHYWADVIIWIDGKQVISGRRRGQELAFAEARVELDKDKQHHVLVKLGNCFSQAYVNVRLLNVDRGPARAACHLPVPTSQAALAAYLPESLDMAIDNYLFFEPDRSARVAVTLSDYSGLPPGLDVPLTATAEIYKAIVKDADSKPQEKLLKKYETRKFEPHKLRAEPFTFSYRLEKADIAVYYIVRLKLQADGKPVGQLERRFYCIEGIEEFGHNVRKRAEKFYKEKSDEEIYGNRDLAYLLLKLEEVKLLYDTERGSPTFGDRALEFVLDAEKYLTTMEKRLHIARGPGMHEFAYISRVDDSAQPYYIYEPMTYDPMAGAPLIVYLHGYARDLNKINWALFPRDLQQLCEKYGYLMLAPFGRSNTDFQAIGEEDVMHVLNLTMRQYHVQADRVFLVGYSMGGTGAYTIAGHYPDRFAGVVALAGRPSYYIWKQMEPQSLQPFKRWLIELEFAEAFAENYRHLPLLALQGEYDSLVRTQQSTRFTSRLKALGYDANYTPIPGSDHWIAQEVFSTDRVFEWMEKRRRPEAPPKVSFTTVSLRYNKAYWVTIDALAKWGLRATIDAESTAPNEITVRQTNVGAFSVQPHEKLIDATKPVVVKADGKEFVFDAPIKGPLKIVLQPGKPSNLRKKPSLCGPFKEVHNERFAFVYGTRGNPIENQALYKQAEKAVREWRDFVKAVPLLSGDKDILMVRDRELQDEHRQKYNLVLIGTPRTNSVFAEVAGKLPIKVKDDGKQVVYVVGNKTFTAAISKDSGESELGLCMIYPSPINPDRYIAVRSGLYYGDGLSINHKFDLLPDYIIYDGARDGGVGDWDGWPNYSRCAGFFDDYWRLDEDLMWTQEPSTRKVARPGD